jgi:hypothetical protein
MSAEAPRLPSWDPPAPFGQPESIQSLGGFAAPLLAGFSITFLTLVISADPVFARWPDATVLVLLLATLALITAVQTTVAARRWHVTPVEVAEWYPDKFTEGKVPEDLPTRNAIAQHRANSQLWGEVTRFTYNLGILCLLGAIAVALVPPGPIAGARWTVIAVAAVGFSGEFVWVVFATAAKAHAWPAARSAAAFTLEITALLAVLLPGDTTARSATAATALGLVVVLMVVRSTGWQRIANLSVGVLATAFFILSVTGLATDGADVASVICLAGALALCGMGILIPCILGWRLQAARWRALSPVKRVNARHRAEAPNHRARGLEA